MKSTGYIYLVLFILLPWMEPVFAQQAGESPGKTEIMQDPLVDLLLQKHIEYNRVVNSMDGFRIQIFSDSGVNSKNKAQEVYEEFQLKFPGVGAYLSFKSPNYKVRVGDFRTRLDAQRFIIDISADYPNVFIIADQINLPKTD